MQHRTPSLNAQSGASLKIRAVFNVLSIFFCFDARDSYQGDAPKKKKQGRRRRITTAISGLGVAAVRFIHVLKSGDPGANVGAFAENAAIPLRAPVAFLTRGVS